LAPINMPTRGIIDAGSGNHGDEDDFLGIVSSMAAELIWFFLGFAVLRSGLLSRLLSQDSVSMLYRHGIDLFDRVVPGGRKHKCARNEALDACTKAALPASDAMQEASTTIETEFASGRPDVVLKIWRKAAVLPQGGHFSVETLSLVAQAFAEVEPGSLVDELVSYVAWHADSLAKHSTLHALIDALGKYGRGDVLDALASASRQKLGIDMRAVTREALLTAFASCGDEARVHRISEEMREADQELTPRGYAKAIRNLAQRSRIEAAVRLAQGMKAAGHDVPPRSMTEIIRGASGQGNVIWAAREILSLGPLPGESISYVIGECCRREDVDTAKMVERIAIKAGTALPYGVHESLLKMYARAGHPRSVELFEEMWSNGVHFTEGLCGALLARSSESRCMKLAERVAVYLRTNAMSTLATYKALMKVYAACGCYDKACDLLEDIRADGVEPDTVMYGCLLKFAARCGRSALTKEIACLVPAGDSQNYICLIRAAGRDKDVSRAFALLRNFEAEQPSRLLDIAVYNCTLDVCVTHGDMSRALELVAEIERRSSPNAVTYNTLAKGYCSVADLPRARQAIRQMEKAGIRPDSASYNCILGAATAKRNLRGAWDIIEEMEHDGVKIDCYTVSIMMTATKKAQNAQDADRAFAMLDKSNISPCEDDVLFNTVLDACIHRRERWRLANVLGVFEVSHMRPSVHTYGLLIKAYSLLNRFFKCRDLWREMVDESDIQPNEITLSCMMDALVCAGTVKEAMKLFRTWQPKIIPNTVIYSTLMKGFAKIGDADSAMSVFEEARASGVAMNLVAYTTLIDAQGRVGNMQRALELLKQMEEDGIFPNTITYSTLVKGCCVRGDLGRAREVLQEMLDRGLKADSVVFNTLLDGCVRHSRFDLADKLLAELDMFGVKPTNFTLSIVVKMWGKRRELTRAFGAIQTMPRKWGFQVDAQVGTCLISACVNNGAVDQAVKALEEMKSWPNFAGPDMNTYGVIISALARQGRCRLAAAVAEEACTGYVPASRENGGKCGLRAGSSRSAGAIGVEPLRQLFRALGQQPELMEEVGRPLAAKLHAAGVNLQSLRRGPSVLLPPP